MQPQIKQASSKWHNLLLTHCKNSNSFWSLEWFCLILLYNYK